MSALCGFLNLDSAPADPQLVAKQVARLKHRGPDGSGAFTEGPVAIGHLLMRITPEADRETSPFRSVDGQLVIAFDGRLDHRGDLLESLAIPSHERNLPDPALILRAYEKWGAECPAHLEGEFAFALWDRRQQELFCSRDHVGAREFFYCHAGNCFAFASEIKGVLCIPGVPRELDEFSLGCRIAALGQPPGRTLYRDIHTLPAARTLTLRAGGPLVIRPYWQLTMEPELRLSSSQDYADGLRERMERAVRSALRTRHAVASMLSGGLDSTGISGLAARELVARGQPLVTVSNVLPEEFQGDAWRKEESAYIRAALDMHPTMVPAFARGLMFPAIEFDDAQLERLDTPNSDHHDFRTRELVVLAKQRGARVLLSGLGGDMAVSYKGDGYLAQLASRGRWLELARQLRLQAQARQMTAGSIFKREVLRALAPAWVRRWHSQHRHGARTAWRDTGINSIFATRLNLDRVSHELGYADPHPCDQRRLSQAGINRGREVSGGLRWLSVHDPAIESSHPCLDRRVLEWVYRIPLREFSGGGVPRAVYRNALRDVLPNAILSRTDKGWFGPDTDARVQACVPSIEGFLEAHPQEHEIWGYFSLQDIRSTLNRLRSRSAGLTPQERNASRLVAISGLRLAHFVSWLRRP